MPEGIVGVVMMAFAFAAVASLGSAFVIEALLVGALYSPGSILTQG